jgi:hypothetical protein
LLVDFCIWQRVPAALPALSGMATAQTYPTRAVTVIVPFAKLD